MKAIWNNKIIAQSDDIVELEGNAYFPEESIQEEYFEKSTSQTTCPWKGTAEYYSLKVDGEVNADAAWYYPNPSKEAEKIKKRIAFWKGVQVVKNEKS